MDSIQAKLKDILRNRIDRVVVSVRETEYVCTPDCDICRGIGWFTYEVEINHPEFGKAQRCPKVPYPNHTGTVDLPEWNQVLDLGNAKKAEKVIREVLTRGYGWVFLWGKPGLGKTVLLKAAVADYYRKEIGSRYVRMAEILDNIRMGFDQDHPDSVARLERWQGVNLLAIDEFDRLNETPYAKERKFLLMDKRYEGLLRQENITLMAANENPSHIDSYLADRIEDGRGYIVEMTGESLRPAMDQESLL